MTKMLQMSIPTQRKFLGIDPLSEMLKIAQEKYPDLAERFILAGVEDLGKKLTPV